jgi:hypothetical protein
MIPASKDTLDQILLQCQTGEKKTLLVLLMTMGVIKLQWISDFGTNEGA